MEEKWRKKKTLTKNEVQTLAKIGGKWRKETKEKWGKTKAKIGEKCRRNQEKITKILKNGKNWEGKLRNEQKWFTNKMVKNWQKRKENCGKQAKIAEKTLAKIGEKWRKKCRKSIKNGEKLKKNV